MVAELQGAEFADFSKLHHPSWSTTAELEASVEPRNDVIVGIHVCQSRALHTYNCNRDLRKAINNASEVYPANKDKERCIALHKVPFYNDERPQAKKRRKRWVFIYS